MFDRQRTVPGIVHNGQGKKSAKLVIRYNSLCVVVVVVVVCVHNTAFLTIFVVGACSNFSGGLDFVGLIRRPRLFPKAVLIELLEDEYLKAGRKDNVHVVYYSEIDHAVKRDPAYKCVQPAMVHPLKPIRNRFYENMKDFASVVVETTPPDSTVAKAIAQTPTRVPEQWILNLSMASTYLPAAIMVGVVKQVGPIGPAAAAAWLFANWWLY